MKINAGQASSTLIPTYIGSDFDKVITVADNIEAVIEAANGIKGMPVISYIGEKAPEGGEIAAGSEWYCTTDGRTYVLYEDDDSLQWVEASPQSPVEENADTYTSIRALWERSAAEAGLHLVHGSFENGATVGSINDVVLYKAEGKIYSWIGAYPSDGYIVPPNTNPVGNANYVSHDVVLRSELSSSGGANLVNSEYRRTF